MPNQLLRWIITPLEICPHCGAGIYWRVSARPRGFTWNGTMQVLSALFYKATPCPCDDFAGWPGWDAIMDEAIATEHRGEHGFRS